MNNDNTQRLKLGKQASMTGIGVNFLLFTIKIIIGISAKSMALVADAVNNFTDMATAIISLVGFNMASKPADDEHPFGHGRMEDIAALIVAVLITSIGLNFGKSGIEKILNPSAVEINLIQTLFIVLTVFFKIGLFFYFRYIGKKINSLSLCGAAFDSLSDTVGTLLVLLAFGISYFCGIQLDGYATLLVSLIILKGGFDLLKETIEPLMGSCPPAEIVEKIKQVLLTNPQIHGVHDIIIHSYGHNYYFATAHAELSEKLSCIEAHDILEQAEINLAKKLPVTLVLHGDPFKTDDPVSKIWRVRLENKLLEIDELFKLYDFKIVMEPDVVRLYFHLLTPRKYLMHENEIKAILEDYLKDFECPCELNITYINSFV